MTNSIELYYSIKKIKVLNKIIAPNKISACIFKSENTNKQ